MITTLEKAQLVLNAPVAYPEMNFTPSPTALALIPQSNRLPISSDLHSRHTQIQQLATRTGCEIRFVGAAHTFSEPRVFAGRDSDWVLMNLTHDPCFYQNGNRLIAPKIVFHHLSNLMSQGIEFDALFIAHELPKGYVHTGEPIPMEYLIPPPPAQKIQRLQTLQAITGTYLKGVQMGLAVSAGVVAAAVTTAAAVALLAPVAIGGIVLGAAFSLATGVDPILFGLLIDRTTPVEGGYAATWYYLTHWYW